MEIPFFVPNEVLLHLFSFLDFVTLNRIQRVSKHWKQFAVLALSELNPRVKKPHLVAPVTFCSNSFFCDADITWQQLMAFVNQKEFFNTSVKTRDLNDYRFSCCDSATGHFGDVILKTTIYNSMRPFVPEKFRKSRIQMSDNLYLYNFEKMKLTEEEFSKLQTFSNDVCIAIYSFKKQMHDIFLLLYQKNEIEQK